MANQPAKIQIRCQQCGHVFNVPSRAAWVICPKCGHSDDDLLEHTSADADQTAAPATTPGTLPPRPRAHTMSGLGAMGPNAAEQMSGGPASLARIALRRARTDDGEERAPAGRRRSAAAQANTGSDPFAGSDDEFVGALIGGEGADPETIINTDGSEQPQDVPDRTAVGVETTHVKSGRAPTVGALRQRLGIAGAPPAPPPPAGALSMSALEVGTEVGTSAHLAGTGIDLPPRPLSPSRRMNRPPEADDEFGGRTGVDLPPSPSAPRSDPFGPRSAAPGAWGDADADEGYTGIDLPPRPSGPRGVAQLQPPSEVTGVDLPARPDARGDLPQLPSTPGRFADDLATGIDLPPRPGSARAPSQQARGQSTGADLPQRPTGRPVDMDFFDDQAPDLPSAVARADRPAQGWSPAAGTPRQFAPLSDEVPIETDLGVPFLADEEVIDDDNDDDDDDYDDAGAPVALAIHVTSEGRDKQQRGSPDLPAPKRAAIVLPAPQGLGPSGAQRSTLPNGSPLSDMPTVGDDGATLLPPTRASHAAAPPGQTLPTDRPLLTSLADEMQQSAAESRVPVTGALDIAALELSHGAASMQLTPLAADLVTGGHRLPGIDASGHDSADRDYSSGYDMSSGAQALRSDMPGLGGPVVDLGMPVAASVDSAAPPHTELTLNKQRAPSSSRGAEGRPGAPASIGAGGPGGVGSIGLDEDDDDEPTRAAGIGHQPTMLGGGAGGELLDDIDHDVDHDLGPDLAQDIADDIADEISANPTVTTDRRPVDGAPITRLPSDISGPAPAVLQQEGIMVFVPDAPIVERQEGVRHAPHHKPHKRASAVAAAPAPLEISDIADELGDAEPAGVGRRSEAAGHGLAIRAGAREKERRTWLIVLAASLGAALLLVVVLVLINQLG